MHYTTALYTLNVPGFIFRGSDLAIFGPVHRSSEIDRLLQTICSFTCMCRKLLHLINIARDPCGHLIMDLIYHSLWFYFICLEFVTNDETKSINQSVTQHCKGHHWFENMFILILHDNVIKWKHFPRYFSFVRGIHRSPVNSPHKGQWHGA